jgi:tetratricopeptide (TPR) repeat protein
MENNMKYHPDFELCFNNLIAHNYNQAISEFTVNYYKYPANSEFLFGLIISYILTNNIQECIIFLENESSVSQYGEKIENILDFFRTNMYFKDSLVHNTLFNTGLFFRKADLKKDAAIFFRIYQVLQPHDPKILTILGEKAIADGDYDKGLRLFSLAAVKEKTQ